MATTDKPIVNSPVVGGKVETVFDKDGVTPVSPSTLANQVAEGNKGHNPDYFPSTGGTQESQNAVGKGANPSADIVTKNDTTIDPVHGKDPATNDGETTVDSVPAVLPANAPLTEPDGTVHKPGVEPAQAPVKAAVPSVKKA